MVLSTVRKEVEVERKKSRFEGDINIEEKEILLDHSTNKPINTSFSGCINSKTKEVDISYKPSYEEKKPGKTVKAVKSITRHEINHIGDARLDGKGCPKTLENHLELYDAVQEVLTPKGYTAYDIQYMVNAFEDFLDNINISSGFDIEGLVRFYEDVGENSGYSNFYSTFVKLQSIFFYPNKYKKLLNKFCKKEPEVRETLESFLEKSKLNEFKTEIDVGGTKIKRRDREAMLDYVNTEERWSELAKIFAEEFSKLMEPGYALPLPGLSGEGTKGREISEDEGEGINWEDLEGGNFFDREMHDSETRKKQAWKRFQHGKERPNWIPYHEALNAVYEKTARRLNIKSESFTRTSKMPISWYGKRDFDPEKDRPKHLTFGFTDNGDVTLKRKKWSYDIPLNYKVDEKGFPEVRFALLDTSDSMSHAPDCSYRYCDESCRGNTNYIPWGTNSRYHYAMLAWYGFIEYLRQNNLLNKTTISLATFSEDTILAKGLDNTKKRALSPEFGRTFLNTDKIEEMFKNRGILMFTISDGYIMNWSDGYDINSGEYTLIKGIKDKFIKEAKKHYYFHLQIGDSNEMTEDLERAGIPVYYVKGELDLYQKVIEISEGLYRKPKKDTTSIITS